MKELKNKKGFTLVELLAVIVILALIMAIAIYSISGILQNSREGVFKDTALSVIKGVRMQLMSVNAQEAGTYYFTSKLLENDNELPFGGKINYAGSEVTSSGTAPNITYTLGTKTVTPIASSSGNTPVYKAVSPETTCNGSSVSYVQVSYDVGTGYTYSICLVPTGASASSGRYINGTEAQLMGNSEQTIFPIN